MDKITYDTIPRALDQLFLEIHEIKQLLQEKGLQSQAETDQPLTIKQAAELLSLSVPTLYGLVHKAQIPVSKKGKRLYFSRQELIAWIKSGRKKTIYEIKVEAENYLANNNKR